MIIYNAWDLEPADKVVLVSDLKEYVSKAMHDFHAREELFELIKEVPNENQTTNQVTKGAAMSELEKAKQIAAEAFNFKSKAYTTIEQQNEIIEVNRKAFMQILSLSSLTIPQSIADELEEEIEEAYSNDYIRSYSDVGAYMEVITDGLDEDSELYKFMFPDDALLGCSHRNIIYLYLVDNDLVKVVEG